MKRISHLLVLWMVAVVTSCIEEYNELPAGTSERLVVIEGQIVSESECIFTLGYSAALGESAAAAREKISDALVCVKGANGDVFEGDEIFDSPGHYVVKVGKLDADVSYHLEVNTADELYTSQPLQPLDAPEITELIFEQPRTDRMVDFCISTAEPHGLVYYKWEYLETWEIITPHQNFWEYVFFDPEAFERWKPERDDMPVPAGKFQYVEPDQRKDHGWSRNSSKELMIASNSDYGKGAIQRLCIYQRSPNDNRFQTRYLTQVRQMAITVEEYEYLHLMATQSTEMGGLFTQMPSELPGNISGQNGSKAIGYIGVRGYVAEAEIYVNRKEVDHADLYHVKMVPDSLVLEPPYMIKSGFRIADYNPYMGTESWTDRWVVDCTDPFWGASPKRPEYWREAEHSNR